jgi:hypothetical protein
VLEILSGCERLNVKLDPDLIMAGGLLSVLADLHQRIEFGHVRLGADRREVHQPDRYHCAKAAVKTTFRGISICLDPGTHEMCRALSVARALSILEEEGEVPRNTGRS